MRRHASVWVLVEAARANSGPAKHAVVEMGRLLWAFPLSSKDAESIG